MSPTKQWVPPVAFYFSVKFDEGSGISDVAFTEVSGLGVELEFDEVEEGGENRFRHQLPRWQKHKNLVCKRDVYPLEECKLSKWVAKVLNGDYTEKIIPTNVHITLLNADGSPSCEWFLTGLYPLKWDIVPFSSKKNDLAIETIEFAYNLIRRTL